MNDIQNIKKMLMPGLRGLPVIIGCFLIAVMIAYRTILYTNPMYETTAKIKLDDIGYGISSSTLYEDFDVFTNTNKIAAEVEVLKSKVLMEKTLRRLDFEKSYYRVGKIRTKELYRDCPFVVDFAAVNPRFFNESFDLIINSSEGFHIYPSDQKPETAISGSFGDTLFLQGVNLVVNLNDSLLARRPNMTVEDHYQFSVHSFHYLVDKVIGDIDIKAIDKDVAVLRLSYKSPVPEKAALVVNMLAKTYLEDYIDSRTGAAGKTVKFIDEQLAIVAKKLAASEAALEKYRLDHNIINVRQETETDLRKISQMKIQLANLEMNEAALDTLYEYIHNSDKHILDMAPNFEAFNDLLSTELVKQLKAYQSERKALLIKYTEKDERVRVLDENVRDIEVYLRESIKNTRRNIEIKRNEIAQTIRNAEKVFIGLPTKEKALIILERDFQLNQKVYNFLTEKRTESAIAEAVNVSFHRIIQHGRVPQRPFSPNKTLILIVSGMLGLIVGITFIYVREFIGGKIRDREELEKLVATPVAGVVKKYKEGRHDQIREEHFLSLASNLALVGKWEKGLSLMVTSTVTQEGKSFVAQHLAQGYADLGWKVILVDLNLRAPMLHHELGLLNTQGITDVILDGASVSESIQHLNGVDFLSVGRKNQAPLRFANDRRLAETVEQLSSLYDIVIIDAPATAIAPEACNLMKLSDQVLYLVRANYTKSHYLSNADLLAEEYSFDHIQLILNGVHQATNYTGQYTGSRLFYRKDKWKIKDLLKHYRHVYL